jgi:hypothetical protein
MTRHVAWWLLFAVPGLAAGCNAIWGVDEFTYGDVPSSSSSTATTSTESSTTETSSDGGGGSGGSAVTDCAPDTDQDVGACERCGALIEHCGADGFWEAAVCQGQGVCESGATEPSDCADCEQRICTDACSWGACEHIPGCCTPSCAGAVCGGADGCGGTCRGDNNDACSAPAETWRCVWIDYWNTWGSQVCRNGHWITYHLNPRDCGACCGGFSTACCLASGCS